MRHPIYALSILLMLCTLVVVPTLPVAVIAFIHIALMIVKAHNEERFLVGLHGAAYRHYLDRTGRFFPRLRAGAGEGADRHDGAPVAPVCAVRAGVHWLAAARAAAAPARPTALARARRSPWTRSTRRSRRACWRSMRKPSREQDVREVLAHVPAPRIIALHGSVPIMTMAPFAEFLIAMGYPAERLRNPRDGRLTLHQLRRQPANWPAPSRGTTSAKA